MVSPDSEVLVSADTAAEADDDTEDRSDVESDVTVEADTKEAEVSTPAAVSDEDTDLSNSNQGDNVKFVTTACGDQVSGGDDDTRGGAANFGFISITYHQYIFGLYKYIFKIEISIFDRENDKNRQELRIIICFRDIQSGGGTTINVGY